MRKTAQNLGVRAARVLIRSAEIGNRRRGAFLDQSAGARRMTEQASTASPALIEDFLIELHERISGVNGGKVADYIPQLGKADPATY